MEKELEIVDNASKISHDSNLMDFSCQFSYHTIESTEGEAIHEPEPESEETEERTLTPDYPESLSSQPEQLSSSENEKMSVYRPPPDLNDIKDQIKRSKKERTGSFTHNKKELEKQRNMVLLDQPYVPKGIKHKKDKSENPSEESGSYMEERYYKRKPSDESPRDDGNSTYAKTGSKGRDSKRRNPNFAQNPREIVKEPEKPNPEVARSKNNKSKNDPKKKNLIPTNTFLSGHSLDSYPVRLEGSQPTPRSEESKAFSEFETPSEVEQLYKDIFKDLPQDTVNNLTSLSQKSKNSGHLNSHRDHQKDWANTPLYDEYEKAGVTLKDSKFDPTFTYKKTTKKGGGDCNFYNEEESKQVYEFVRGRYDNHNYDKSIKSFYEKALNTL